MHRDLEAGERVGRFNRIKERFPFALFQAGGEPPSGRHIPYVLPADVASLRVRLRGMRVLLVRGPCLPPSPYKLDELLAMPPLSLIVLSGMLRAHGAETVVRDLCLSRRRWRDVGDDPCGKPGPRLLGRLVKEIRPGQADLVAFSVESAADMRLGLSLTRELAGKVPVVIGGREVRLDEPLLADCPEARVIAGEGEVPLLLFADALRGGRPLSEVPGLNWSEGGRRRSHSSVLHDLDCRPVFDLTGVPLGGYTADILREGDGPLVPYQFNIGCQFLCGFCNSFSRREFRLRSPELVVADLRAAVRQGVRRFYFINHLLNGDPRHLRELVERLEAARLGIVWADCCRTAGLDEALLRRLRKVGASQLVWGVDCASPALARRMKKSSDPAQAPAVLAAARRAGICNVVNLIIGMPRETERDVEETLRFIRRVRPFVDRFNVSPYGFDPNCPLARDPAAYGLRPGSPEPLPVPDPETTARRLARVEAAARG